MTSVSNTAFKKQAVLEAYPGLWRTGRVSHRQALWSSPGSRGLLWCRVMAWGGGKGKTESLENHWVCLAKELLCGLGGDLQGVLRRQSSPGPEQGVVGGVGRAESESPGATLPASR